MLDGVVMCVTIAPPTVVGVFSTSTTRMPNRSEALRPGYAWTAYPFVHGSVLFRTEAAREAVAWLNAFAEELDWRPEVVDLGGGLGVPTVPGDSAPSIAEWVRVLLDELRLDARARRSDPG